MATRPVNQGIAILREMIGLACQVRKVLYLECEVMQLCHITNGTCNPMMIRIAAHPDELIFHPIGNAESQHFLVEIGAAFAITYLESDMAKFARLNSARPIIRVDLRHLADQFNHKSFGIAQA